MKFLFCTGLLAFLGGCIYIVDGPAAEVPLDAGATTGACRGADGGGEPDDACSQADALGQDSDRVELCPANVYTAAGQPCNDPNLICNADGSRQLCSGCPDEDCAVLLCEQGAWRLYEVSACALDAGIGDDAAEEHSCPSNEEAPASVASTQTVTFVIENDSAQPQYLALRGWFCDAFGVAPVGGSTIPRAVGFECGCECPNPGAPRIESYVEVEAGSSYTFSWDARRLQTYTTWTDCSEYWGDFCVDETAGVLLPLAAGRYELRIPFEPSLPEDCWEAGDGSYTCSIDWEMGGDYWDMPQNPQQLCPATVLAAAEFVLPESGDAEAHLRLIADSAP